MDREKMSIRELTVDRMLGGGVGDLFAKGIGSEVYLNAALGSNGNPGKSPKFPISSLTGAYAMLPGNKNDVIWLQSSTSGLSLAANLAWSKNLTHMLGVWGGGGYAIRSRIGMSANFSPMLTVSGYGNQFGNLYLQHGRGDAGNLTCLNVTGSRNRFSRVHVAGAQNATEAGTAGYKLVTITGEENEFENCIFGTDTTARGAANRLLSFNTGAARNVFRNCTFITMISAGTPLMIGIDGPATGFCGEFYNCKFIAYSTNFGTAMAECVKWGIGTQAALYFDKDCELINITDWIAAGDVSHLYIGVNAATDTALGLAINPA